MQRATPTPPASRRCRALRAARPHCPGSEPTRERRAQRVRPDGRYGGTGSTQRPHHRVSPECRQIAARAHLESRCRPPPRPPPVEGTPRCGRWLTMVRVRSGSPVAVGLVYPRLDTVVGFYLQGLVTLDASQSHQLKRILADNLQWHHSSELDLLLGVPVGEMAGAVERGAGREDWFSGEPAHRAEREVFEQAAPGLCRDRRDLHRRAGRGAVREPRARGRQGATRRRLAQPARARRAAEKSVRRALGDSPAHSRRRSGTAFPCARGGFAPGSVPVAGQPPRPARGPRRSARARSPR